MKKTTNSLSPNLPSQGRTPDILPRPSALLTNQTIPTRPSIPPHKVQSFSFVATGSVKLTPQSAIVRLPTPSPKSLAIKPACLALKQTVTGGLSFRDLNANTPKTSSNTPNGRSSTQRVLPKQPIRKMDEILGKNRVKRGQLSIYNYLDRLATHSSPLKQNLHNKLNEEVVSPQTLPSFRTKTEENKPDACKSKEDEKSLKARTFLSCIDESLKPGFSPLKVNPANISHTNNLETVSGERASTWGGEVIFDFDEIYQSPENRNPLSQIINQDQKPLVSSKAFQSLYPAPSGQVLSSREFSNSNKENMPPCDSHRKMNESPSKKNAETYRNEQVVKALEDMAVHMREQETLKKFLQHEKRQLHENLRNTLEGLDHFTNTIIKILQENTEAWMLKLSTDLGKELETLDRFNMELEGFGEEFLKIKEDLKASVKNGEPSYLEMVRYEKRVNCFQDLAQEVKQCNIKRNNVPVYEELMSFKRRLSSVLDGVFSDIKLEREAKQKRAENKSPMSGTVPSFRLDSCVDRLAQLRTRIGQNEGLRASKSKKIERESEEKMVNPVLISFENQDIFENALQSGAKTNSAGNSTRDTKGNTFFSHIFRSDSEELGSNFFSDGKKTPRLNFEFWKQSEKEVNEFTQEDEKELSLRCAREVSFGCEFSKALKDISLKQEGKGACKTMEMNQIQEDCEESFLSYLDLDARNVRFETEP